MISFLNSRLLLSTALALCGACSGNGNFVSAGSDKESKSDDDDESADPPEVVTGAYLTCVDTNDADADEVSYGCSLSKSNGKMINLPDIANEWKWQALPPQSSEHKVKVIDKSSSGDNAIFLFSGGEKADLKKYAEETQVALSMNLKKSVPNYKPFRSKIKDAGPLGTSSEGDTTSSSTNDKLKIPEATPANGTVSGGEPVKLPELPANIPDRDKDGIADSEDLCNNTPSGSNVWKDGEWKGCAGSEFKDVDDTDLDHVSNSVDVCPTTPSGSIVDLDPSSPTYGCGPTEVIF